MPSALGVAEVIAVLVLGGLGVAAAWGTYRSRRFPPEFDGQLRALGFKRLDATCWVRRRERAPTLFYLPHGALGAHDLWVHDSSASVAVGLQGIRVTVAQTPAGTLDLQVRRVEERAPEPLFQWAREWLEPASAPLLLLPRPRFNAEWAQGSYRLGLSWETGSGPLVAHTQAALVVFQQLEAAILSP